MEPNQNEQMPNESASSEKYAQQASEFISNKSLDEMLEIAQEAVRKKALERASTPPQWVYPED